MKAPLENPETVRDDQSMVAFGNIVPLNSEKKHISCVPIHKDIMGSMLLFLVTQCQTRAN
jgi:hypothetical protein